MSSEVYVSTTRRGNIAENLVFVVQGKRHQQNLAKRAAREAAEKPVLPQAQKRVTPKKTGEMNSEFLVALNKISCLSLP